MWLTNSSIGRKLVMAVTGACLILFVTFHVLMNAVALISPDAYNQVCAFLGANWYALVASAGLAALFIIHIIYAVWLTIQNRKARGNDRYNVVSKPPQVEWASQNMLVLGIVILAFLCVHMYQFWAKMQLAELMGNHCPDPANGAYFIKETFKDVWVPIVYIIGFVALWFHMNHGFWSMFQSAGWNNDIWIKRLKCIGCWWTTIVVALFIAQAVTFHVQAKCDCPENPLAKAAATATACCPTACTEAQCGEKCGEATTDCCGQKAEGCCQEGKECCGGDSCTGDCPDCPNHNN